MDSGASEHVVANARYLSDMQKILPMHVELADRIKANATYKGIVNVVVGVRKAIQCRMYLIPTLKFNFISCSRLNKYGWHARSPAVYVH